MASSRQFSVAYRKKNHHGQNHQLQAVKRHFPPVVYSSCKDGLFCKVCAMFEPFDSADRRGLVNIPFNRYSKLYGAAGKLTTHGSQHLLKQNALKAVAFLNRIE